MVNQKCGPVVVIEGVDGSGKSTTAQTAAHLLSREYPQHFITVIDSCGVETLSGGLTVSQKYEHLQKLDGATATGSRLGRLAAVGGFTIARRRADVHVRQLPNDLIISVRDPFRIDPAVYAPIFAPLLFERFSPTARLRLFGRLTNIAPPDHILHLQATTGRLASAFEQRASTVAVARHETPDTLERIGEELAVVLDAFHRLYGTPLTVLEGLQPLTPDETAAAIEPYLPRPAPYKIQPAAPPAPAVIS